MRVGFYFFVALVVLGSLVHSATHTLLPNTTDPAALAQALGPKGYLILSKSFGSLMFTIRDIPEHERLSVVRGAEPFITPDMDNDDKALLIEIIGRITPSEEREEVLDSVRTLCKKLRVEKNFSKVEIISDLASIPRAQRQEVIGRVSKAFRDERAKGHTKGAEGRWLRILLNGEASRYHDQRRFVNPSQVHQIAGTQVSLPSGSQAASAAAAEAACNASAPQTMRLNDAILHQVRHRLKGIDLLSLKKINATINHHIPIIWTNSADAQRAADTFKKGFEGAPETDLNDLRVIVTFLKTFHPHAVQEWVIGFLGESMDAYDNHGVSCVKGIHERAILGLRGIDKELDAIFKQVEGPEFAKFTFSASNFGDPTGAQFVARKLLELGYVRGKTTPKEAGELYRDYLQSLLEENLSLKTDPKYKDQPKGYAELIRENLEDNNAESQLRNHLYPAADSTKP